MLNIKNEIIVKHFDDSKIVVIDDQNVKNVIIKDMNIAYYSGFSHIALDIQNDNNTAVNYTTLTIKFYTEDNILMYTTSATVGNIVGKSKVAIFLQTDIDLSETSKVVYEIN